MSAAAIAVEGLGKTFVSGWARQPFQALRGINLTVQQGECWALAGPNGAGKTTALHCMLGLLWPTTGRVSVLGQAPRAVRARIGYQPEQFFSYGHLTAREALRFYGRLSGLEGESLESAVELGLKRVDLGGRGDRRLSGFSKGMMQRVGLAQSLLHKPDIVVWDEPTTGLDPEGRALVFELVHELRANHTTVILSTHILDDIARVCSHLAIIAGGQLVVQSSMDTLRAAHPEQTMEQIYLQQVRSITDER